ncbi:MAG: amidohydrolase family protein [Bacteroidales bacterium]|nr:amidohydrolase family protein [Bacteroidales bacterium]
MFFTADIVFPVTSDPIRNGYVQCDDEGRILAVGEFTDSIRDAARDAQEPVIAHRGFLVPGFCNAHCHAELSYMKGMFRQGTGMDGFIRQINALRTTVDYAGRMDAIGKAFNQLEVQGVTCMADISNCNETFKLKSVLKEQERMWVRTFIEVFGTEPEEAESVMEGARKLQEEACAFGIDAAPTPHSCYTMSPLLNRLSAAAGLESGYISYHSQESDEEENMLRYGSGPLAEDYRERGTTQLPVTGTGALVYFLENLKRAVSAPVTGNVLLVHNVATDQESIDAALRDLQHPYWVLCPLSNLFIHRALPPVELLRANQLKICVGTDSLSSNLQLSMMAELYCLQCNFPQVPLAELLQWACLNGAEAVGYADRFGSFTPGKRPGIVLIEDVDAESIRLTAKSDSIRLL